MRDDVAEFLIILLNIKNQINMNWMAMHADETIKQLRRRHNEIQIKLIKVKNRNRMYYFYLDSRTPAGPCLFLNHSIIYYIILYIYVCSSIILLTAALLPANSNVTFIINNFYYVTFTNYTALKDAAGYIS